MYKAHKIALKPTQQQEAFFRRSVGVARFTYNWALAEWQRQYAAGLKPNAQAIRKQFNAIKADQFPWTYDVAKTCTEAPFANLQRGFNAFYKKVKAWKKQCKGKWKKKRGRNPFAHPKFKKKGKHDSFCAGTDHFDVRADRIRVPRLGWVRMREALRLEGRLIRATISRQADRWYVAILVEVADPQPIERKNHGSVGVDLGITHLATLSTGEQIAGPRALMKHRKRLRMLHKAQDRKQRGSRNWQKAKVRVARQYAKVSNVRRDALHKLSTGLVRRFEVIGIEDLHVQNMQRNRRLSPHIVDMGWYELRQQLEYKGSWYGSQVVVADPFFPSSRLCYVCGNKNADLQLQQRRWTCPRCGIRHDRDINAAKNLERWAVGFTVTACCPGSAGAGHVDGVQLLVGQESDGKSTGG